MDHRKIIHIDMDAFYASVEQLDNPELRGKPVAVGGNSQRGVVAAASYEARKFGVKSAMPSAKAAKQCPHLVFVPPRFSRYKELSSQIREVFFEYTDLVEPLSLDEAYLDVTQNKIGLNSATLIAQEIKEKIKERTGLIASAGISYNKFLAKTASDMDKPDGLYVILPDDAEGFVASLPVHRFHGIGKVTAEKMVKAGIFTGKDLKKKSLEDLKLRYGKSGQYYYNISRGIDTRSVQPVRETKSVSAERTFEDNLYEMADIMEEIDRIAHISYDRYHRSKASDGHTMTLKLKYADFRQITRSKTLEQAINDEAQYVTIAKQLMADDLLDEQGVRLIGVGISNFRKDEEPEQPSQLTLEF
ncbi:DNA polymerase IV [Ekhidna sp. To15]|uniref:DNA polymerase IV n=1 Tax=Ekhidna sp. To15 TaxID=3395267 RepID=UPI003F520A9F